MLQKIQLKEGIAVGGQPSAEEIPQLAREGYRTVVNLRTEGEEDQALSPGEEGLAAEVAGLQYLHIPVSSETMSPEVVDQFRRELETVPAPVYVHCHKGKRAGALAMMACAVEAGWSGNETLRRAEQMGFQCDVPALKEFVAGYVDQRTRGGQP